MRRVVLAIVIAFAICPRASAQQPPRIGPFVVDLHGTVPRFPSDDPQLAQSRKMDLGELPGTGLGIQVGMHLYLLRVKAITFGIGAEFAASRSRQTPQAGATSATTGQLLRPSEARFSTIAPQLSLNFGNGHGWSYLSGGLGTSNWAVVPEGQEGFPAEKTAQSVFKVFACHERILSALFPGSQGAR